MISPSRTGAATNVAEEAIESLPTLSRGLGDFARLSPLSGGGGGTNFGGRSSRYNNIQVDGATLNDVFGLAGSGTPGGQTGSQPITLDAIEEFNLDIAPFDVRYSGFTGGQINAVTKSGTNEFAGTLRLLGRNDDFVGELDGSGLDEFREGTVVATLGGPILRDRLFFFVSGELQGSEFPELTGLADSDATDRFRLGADEVGRVAQIADEVYGYDAGGFGPINDVRASNKLLAKVDWNLVFGPPFLRAPQLRGRPRRPGRRPERRLVRAWATAGTSSTASRTPRRPASSPRSARA